jgi:hypothetical protein
MENKYYPLRIGKYNSVIVSDTDPGRTRQPDEREVEHYGGYLIAESLPPEIAKQMVLAYNKMFGCTHADKPCIGGQMCCQWKISHHDWVDQEKKLDKEEDIDVFTDIRIQNNQEIIRGISSLIKRLTRRYDIPKYYFDLLREVVLRLPSDEPSEDYMDIHSKPGTKVQVSEQSFRNGSDTYKDLAAKHLKIGGVYTITRTDIHNWYTEVYVDEFPGIPFSSVQFVKMTAAQPDPTIDQQIELMKFKLSKFIAKHDQGAGQIYTAIIKNLQSIKRWNESPAYKNVDVVKVIEDLIEVINVFEQTGSYNGIKKTHTIQNAEAAIGMLQAFKQERGHIGIELKTTSPIEPEGNDQFRQQLADQLFDVQGRYAITDAIIFALKNYKP